MSHLGASVRSHTSATPRNQLYWVSADYLVAYSIQAEDVRLLLWFIALHQLSFAIRLHAPGPGLCSALFLVGEKGFQRLNSFGAKKQLRPPPILTA